MKPLAYALIVGIPLTAFITVAVAMIPGRPGPGRTRTTPLIEARIRELDDQLGAGPAPGDSRSDATSGRKALLRERRQLQTELMRRGLGR